MIAHEGIDHQGVFKGVAPVQAAGDVGGWDDDAVGFTGIVGVGFENLVALPDLLPFCLGGGGIVLGREVGSGGKGCSHGSHWQWDRQVYGEYLRFCHTLSREQVSGGESVRYGFGGVPQSGDRWGLQ